MKGFKYFLCIFSLLFVISCESKSTSGSSEPNFNDIEVNTLSPLFNKLSPDQSGIYFENILVENEELNYYSYIHLYMGSGIAASDFNNDGLTDLFFVGELTPNKLYINQDDMKFRDVSAEAGIEGPKNDNKLLKTGVSVHDVNGDGWQDIYVCHSGLGEPESLVNSLYINQQDGTFKEESIARGLSAQSNSIHALFFDYDNDNDLDLFMLNHPGSFKLVNNMVLQQHPDGSITRKGTPTTPHEGDRLYRNDGKGFFTDVTEISGISQRAYGLSITPMDINEDGWMDLYIGNDFIEPDFLWINQKDGTFKNEIDKYFAHTSHNTMGADAGDINNDGRIDFVSLDMLAEDHYRQQTLMTSMRYDRYISLEKYDYGRQIMRNMLFVKGEDGKMRDVGNLSGIDATDWSWSPLIVDFDLDGFNDIYITNGFRRDLTDLDFMTYYDDMIGKGEKPEDNIGELMKIVPTKPIPNYLYRNLGDMQFQNMAAEWGVGEPNFSNGAIHADLDNDGDEDIVINNIDMIAAVYENQADKLRDHHWLQVKLNGPKENPDGIGASVRLQTANGTKHKNIQAIKGFLSYSSPIVTFGLGDIKSVQEIHVIWPDDKEQRIPSPGIDQRIVINYSDAVEGGREQPAAAKPSYFGTESPLFTFTHTENDFVDVKREPLIPRCFSREGPVTQVLDFNNDGRDDILIGGAKGQPARLFVQGASGSFTSVAEAFFEKEKDYEDVAFAIADFNNDGFDDIYVGSGGNADPRGSASYQDRLYFNDKGKGLIKAELPQMLSSTGSVSAADFDGDGDIDLFTGGYITPNAYPVPPRSYLLINNNGEFTDEAEKWSQHLSYPGMVSSSIVRDFNGDGRPDLMLAGEWMPIVWFPNKGNSFGEPIVVENSAGWWLDLHPADLDQDGDLDIVAGNLGQNTKWQASPTQPMEVYGKDFDNNGKFDALITHYVMGRKSVAPRRNILMEQMPSLRPEYVKFSKYAEAQIEDLVDVSQPDVYHRAITQLSSAWLENKGGGNFSLHELPREAQIAPVYAIESMDLDGDNKPEILAGGNDFHLEIETARADGNSLFVLSQKTEKNAWTWSPQDGKLGIFDAALRDIDFISIAGKEYMVLSFNDAPTKVFPVKEGKLQ